MIVLISSKDILFEWARLMLYKFIELLDLRFCSSAVNM